MFDEDLPIKPKDTLTAKDLRNLSVDELEVYISDLRAEITRVEEDIEKKKSVRSAAENIFK